MTRDLHPDLLVIGAGVIGLASALEAARMGLRVTVIERGQAAARGATHAAAGMLSPLGEARNAGALFELGLRSLRMYERWVQGIEEDSGISVEFRKCGKLRVALTDDEVGALEARAILARNRGVPAEWLPPDAIRGAGPQVTPSVRAALLIHDDFRVDNRRLGDALARAATHHGVELRMGTEAITVLAERSRFTGVRLADGSTIPAGRVLLAAGAWSPLLEGLPAPLPVRPVRGQMLALLPATPPASQVIESEDVYLVPRDDGRVLVGATMEEAGYRIENTAAGIRRLLEGAIRLAPHLADAPLTEIWSGLRPGTSDGNPLIGPDPELEGLLIATGHFRNGILLAPITAHLIGRLFEGEGAAVPSELAGLPSELAAPPSAFAALLSEFAPGRTRRPAS
ncbi:MAG: glycine oxidase ThiO [Gemmatimonadota bacterium]